MSNFVSQKIKQTTFDDLNEVTTMVEIAAQSFPIKYEAEEKTNRIFVDRFLDVAMQFPCNYGHIPGTKGGDGDALDALIITPYPLEVGVYIKCRPIGTLNMHDEGGEDTKIIMVPSDKLTKRYHHIQSVEALEIAFPNLSLSIRHFFEHYKDLEKNKWIKMQPGWGSRDTAKQIIIDSVV